MDMMLLSVFINGGSKSFVDERGHYCGTFDSYYIHIPLDGLTEEVVVVLYTHISLRINIRFDYEECF